MKRTLCIGAIIVCIVAPVRADIFGFNRVTADAPDDLASQFFMEATDSTLVVTNAGPIYSSVHAIYFGSPSMDLGLDILSAVSCTDGVNVNFDLQPAIPQNPPGWEEYAYWWSATITSVGSGGNPDEGINPDECLNIELSISGTSSTLLELIYNGDLQVALHVISIGEYSDTFVNNQEVVPEPASILLIGTAGSLIAFVRRRLY